MLVRTHGRCAARGSSAMRGRASAPRAPHLTNLSVGKSRRMIFLARGQYFSSRPRQRTASENPMATNPSTFPVRGRNVMKELTRSQKVQKRLFHSRVVDSRSRYGEVKKVTPPMTPIRPVAQSCWMVGVWLRLLLPTISVLAARM